MEQEIRIGINGSMLDEHPTGVGVFSFNLINHLSFIYNHENSKRLTVFTAAPALLHKTLTIIKLPSLLLSSRYGKLAALSRFVWNTLFYPFKTNAYDVLFSPTTHGSFYARNQIITIHDLLSLRFGNISAHQRFYFKHLLPRLLNNASIIIAVSKTTKNDIIHFFGCDEAKVHIVYNGYDDKHYRTVTLKPNVIASRYKVSNYLLAIGPTYPHKNFEFLIDTYNRLSPATRKAFPLLVAGGKNPYLAKIKEKVALLGLSNEIHFTGYVPAEMMPSLYQEAHALIFPSLYEGFGFPLLEAMACGCPVLTSNTASMPEVCGNAAMYFSPDDEEELLTAINTITVCTDKRNELIEKGLERAKLFSWQKAAKTLKEIIDTHFITN
jgi:glycosyltransferase involved in cell wall biosynthesis